MNNVDLASMNNVDLASMNNVELASMNNVELASMNNVELASMNNVELASINNSWPDQRSSCMHLSTMLFSHDNIVVTTLFSHRCCNNFSGMSIHIIHIISSKCFQSR